jgi:membrane-bound lytic murein transglycosylase MltF
VINSCNSLNRTMQVSTAAGLAFRCLLALSVGVLLTLATGCSEKPKSGENATANSAAPADSRLESVDSAATPTRALTLPMKFDRWTGDFDGMAKRKVIRALVINSKTGFFYDKGRARGVTVEILEEFETFVNKKLRNPNPRVRVVYIPVATSQLASSLNDGLGDIAATGIVISPEREKLVDFTVPLASGVKLIPVTNAAAPSPKTLDELSGQEVWANPLTLAYQALTTLNESLKKAGKPTINLMASDSNLTEEDLLEMTNAGLIPATVAFDFRAQFWAQVYSNIRLHPDVVVRSEGDVAWAMRKNSPQLKQMLDEFLQTHRLGTVFGNMMLKRYLKDTKWVKNSTSAKEMQKFNTYVDYFKQYGQEYNFDYLMLAAQGYQESMLNQDQKSRTGAVGVMQVMPKYAAASPINISHVDQAEPNIRAGVKMLHHITVTYFNDPGIDATNKTLMTFAAYNAGPARVAKLRGMARKQGLDPNVWFGNVELMAAKDIGQETVQYVSNIYKYYVAYKTTLEQKSIREKAKQAVATR